MAGESDDLDNLFESVADGESVDWDALERAAPDEETRALLRRLRLIAEVSEVHRSQVDDVPTPDTVVTGPVAWAGSGWPPPPRVPHVATGAAPGEGGAWGPLLLVKKIGEGSYGEVYQAHDAWLDHPVALKLLKREAETRVQPADLLHEARKLARVRHSNVVTVHGADRHNGRVGFWMDFVDGETLAARVAKGRLSAGEATSIGQEVCQALAAVHRASIIHRDVKAQNVMRAHDGGRIILMDFGAGQFVDDPSLGKRAQGTPLYLAPEVLRGEDATVRSDIYAVGILLYHLVTGRFPVDGASPRELNDAHQRGLRRRLRDERPDLPDSFIAIVERAIDPSPARRYASAGEMEAKLAGEPPTREVIVPPVRPSPPAAPSIVKRVLAAAAIVVALTGVLGFIAARFFEVVIQVDRDFSAGIVDTFVVGARALLAFVVLWLFGGAVLGILAAVRVLFRKSFSRISRPIASLLESSDPLLVGVSIVFVGALCSAVLNTIAFGPLFGAMFALAAEPGTTADISILGPLKQSVHRNHSVLAAYLSILLMLVSWRWFPVLERRASDPATIRVLKWGTVALAFMTLAFATAPRRILWERFPVATFDNRIGFVIGTRRDESLVYAPSDPGRPRIRLRSGDLQRTGETRFLFDPEVRR
jgi:hypothetical protein